MNLHFWEDYPGVYDFIQIIVTGNFYKKISSAINFLNGRKVLDIGCGTGTLVSYLKPSLYMGLDINSNFIKYANKKYPSYSFKVFDLTKDNFPKKNFDYLFIMNVLHHLTDEQVRSLFKKIKKFRDFKEFIIIESKPKSIVGKILSKFDAGSNFRGFNKVQLMVEKEFKIKNKKIVSSPLGTYEYLIIRAR